jgi:hypothetical protein
VVSFTLRPLYPRGKLPRYPIGRRPDGPQSRSGRYEEVRNLDLLGSPARNQLLFKIYFGFVGNRVSKLKVETPCTFNETLAGMVIVVPLYA